MSKLPLFLLTLLLMAPGIVQARSHRPAVDQCLEAKITYINYFSTWPRLKIGSIQDRVDKNPFNPFPGSRYFAVYFDSLNSDDEVLDGILNNPDKQLETAKFLMRNCPNMSSYRTGIANSDYIIQYYRFRDGSVRPEVCTTKPGWGKNPCL